LGLSQEFRHINLGEAGENTCLLQAGPEDSISLTVGSIVQSETSSFAPMNIMMSPNIPKSDIVVSRFVGSLQVFSQIKKRSKFRPKSSLDSVQNQAAVPRRFTFDRELATVEQGGSGSDVRPHVH
jgi:hypothetical protein